MREVRPFEHTADVGIELFATTLAELFEAAAEGFMELLAPRQEVRPRLCRELWAHGGDLEGLLVAWLSELHYLAESEDWLFAGARLLALDAEALTLRGEARGEPFDPARHQRGGAIKAVTYHGLEIEHQAGEPGRGRGPGYRARVLFDV